MKIEIDKKTILKDRRNKEGDLFENINIAKHLEPLFEESYIKGYADAITQIGISLDDRSEYVSIEKVIDWMIRNCIHFVGDQCLEIDKMIDSFIDDMHYDIQATDM